ncbi:hypothetical protein FACS1894111_03460 [Clostridia bacterium]|nr:hypothetical protein FACS1894111_03460 [Clostridia bacterium]
MIQSFQKNKKGIALMLCSALFACVGMLFWKLADKGIGYVIFGFFLYGLGALTMLIAYRYGSLSVLQPMMSTNYILSIVLGYLILHERVDTLKIIGILVIMLGVIIISVGDGDKAEGGEA